MKTSDFYFDLPERLIAKKPTPDRSDSRLMVLDRSLGFYHENFRHLIELLQPGDLLVFNNTRVIPARVFGRKETGGAVEVLVERLLNSPEPKDSLEPIESPELKESHKVLAQVRASKSPKAGSKLILQGSSGEQVEVDVLGREDDFFVLESRQDWIALLDRIGHVPLPPYIDREDELEDKERYQTVYSKEVGAVAAPTAGLHFDQKLLDQLADKGVDFAELTLHVGAGTFQPVRVDDPLNHQMHSEWMKLDEEVVEKVRKAQINGGRVIAVGTTAVRSLETAAASGELKPYVGETDIFIYPGYQFQVVDAMITNFHLPESTLMMLVSAFSGYEEIMQAYRDAVKQNYRFFSYGDAMFLTRNMDQSASSEINPNV